VNHGSKTCENHKEEFGLKPREITQKKRYLERLLYESLNILFPYHVTDLRTWILERLKSGDGVIFAQLIGLPPEPENLTRLFSYDAPFASASINLIGRRLFWFFRPIIETLKNPLSPSIWKDQFEKNITRITEICMKFTQPSLVPTDAKNLFNIYEEKKTKALYYRSPIDPEITMALIHYSQVPAPEIRKENRGKIFLEYISGKIDKAEKILDKSNLWWMAERCLWTIIMQEKNEREELLGEYSGHIDRLVELCLEDIKFNESGYTSPGESLGDTKLSALLGTVNEEKNKFPDAPEIFRPERISLFLGINAMKILTYRWELPDALSIKWELIETIARTLSLDIEEFGDYQHIWWITHQLKFVYELIKWRAVEESFNILKENEYDLIIENEIVLDDNLKGILDPYKAKICTRVRKGNFKPRDVSTVLLGPPGSGKTKLVKYFCGDDFRGENEGLQYLDNVNKLRYFLRGALKRSKEENKVPLIFIDEFHLDKNYDQYAELLAPLEENRVTSVSEESDEKRQWIPFFGSSKYLTKADFILEATRTKRTSMRDFSTRIENWIEIPASETLPVQRINIYLCKFKKDDQIKMMKYDLAKIALDFDLKTNRDIGMIHSHAEPETSFAEALEDPTGLKWILWEHFGSNEIIVKFQTVKKHQDSTRPVLKEHSCRMAG
jgi:GTPase SAR1 family protein